MTASPPHKEGEPVGVQRIVGDPRQLLLLHKTTTAARHSPELHIEIHARIPARKISYGPSLAIVKGPVLLTANAASSFFCSRSRTMIRTWGSPNTPHTHRLGLNPGKRQASSSLFFFPRLQA